MHVGKIRGIEIKIHPSTIIILLLVGVQAGSYYKTMVKLLDLPEPSMEVLFLFGVLNGVLILLSILAHELMHSITAQKLGHRVKEIELYIFGGAAKTVDEFKKPQNELKIAVAGPITSLVIAGVLLGVNFIPINLPLFIRMTNSYIGLANLILGLFNLIPAFPMDGGRILRAYLWKKRGDIVSATRTAAKGGKIFGNLMIFGGIIEMIVFWSLDGIWSVLIGNYVKNLSIQSYLQTYYLESLAKMKIRDISGHLNWSMWAIPQNMSLLNAIRYFFIPYRRTYFPVRDINGKIIGIVHIKDIEKIPVHLRPVIPIIQIMIPIEKIPGIYENIDLKHAFMELAAFENSIPVLAVYNENNELIDFIDLTDIQSALYFSNPKYYYDRTIQTGI